MALSEDSDTTASVSQLANRALQDREPEFSTMGEFYSEVTNKTGTTGLVNKTCGAGGGRGVH